MKTTPSNKKIINDISGCLLMILFAGTTTIIVARLLLWLVEFLF